MPYSPTTWVSGTTPCSAGNLNNIENGVAGAYTELESITANDGTALPASNGPFTLANFINYLTTLVKSIVGGAHWYSAVPTSLTSLSTGKADLSGATFTGPVNGTTVTLSSHLTAGDAALTSANTGLEMGAKASANTPFIDFNSSGNSNDYDARIIASGGGASNGQGTLTINAASVTTGGALSTDGGKLFTDGNGNLTALLAAAPGSNTAPFSTRVTGDTSTRAGVAIGGSGLSNSGYLFVSKGGTSTIFRLYTDGTNIVLDSGGLTIPGGITLQSGKNAFYAQAGLTGKFSAQSTAPASPADGDLWLDTSTVLS